MGKKGDVRARILEAAAALLRDKGILRVAQPQVAKSSGIPQGHITYYFPKRADLLLALEENSMQSLGEEILAGLARSKGGLRLQAVLAVLGGILKDRTRASTLLGLLVESDENPELKKKLRERWLAGERLVADGLNRRADDPETRIVHATNIGLAIFHFLFEDAQSRRTIDVFLKGLPKQRLRTKKT